MQLKANYSYLEKWIVHLNLLAQVEGKNRLRNSTLILHVVKEGDASSER